MKLEGWNKRDRWIDIEKRRKRRRERERITRGKDV